MAAGTVESEPESARFTVRPELSKGRLPPFAT